ATTVTAVPANLKGTNVSFPAGIYSREKMTFSYTVTNVGRFPGWAGPPGWTDFLWVAAGGHYIRSRAPRPAPAVGAGGGGPHPGRRLRGHAHGDGPGGHRRPLQPVDRPRRPQRPAADLLPVAVLPGGDRVVAGRRPRRAQRRPVRRGGHARAGRFRRQ